MDVTPNHSGRPKEYCDKRCRDAAYRRRSAVDASGAAEEGGYAAAVAADYTGHARLAETAALTPGADAARELLRLLRSSGLPREDLVAAAVRRARLDGLATAEIADALGMSAKTLRKRWSREAVERRIRQRDERPPFTTTFSQALRGPDAPATTPHADVRG
ncbi:hypothetical protein ACFVUW_26560 [Streptomyces xiamenensis]|uniref:hypothetical protein n=1 Tax=Streptomyces xiamenensis TaxID=408015 RepID=UPI0036E8A764